MAMATSLQAPAFWRRFYTQTFHARRHIRGYAADASLSLRRPRLAPSDSSSRVFFGTTARQTRAGKNSGDDDKDDDSTTFFAPRSSSSSSSSSLLLLPRTNLPRDALMTTNESSFMASSHAIDLYDPHTHGGGGGNGGFDNPLLSSSLSNYEPPTPLWTNVLLPLLSVLGRPISTADYMRLCLTHPEYGYYINATSNSAALTDDDDDDYDDDDYEQTSDDANKTSTTIIGADFVTAPEVSQVFGECLGIWFATQHLQKQQKQQKQQPQDTDSSTLPWQWVECGPGKGTLMRDILEFQSAVPEFCRGCRHVHFVETSSPRLRALQKTRLQEVASQTGQQLVFHDDDGTGKQPPFDSTTTITADDASSPSLSSSISVHWHDTFTAFEQWTAANHNDAQDGPMATYCIGQEFIDALPVYSFEKTPDDYWRERLVSLPSDDGGDEGNKEATSHDTGLSTEAIKLVERKPRLVLVLAPEVTPALRTLLDVDDEGYLANDSNDVAAGSVMEVCPEGILLVQDMARFFERNAGGGAALLIDYGQRGSADSLRAFSRHEQLGFLSRPGLVDITADVDFAALEHAVNHGRHGKGVECKNASDGSNDARAFGPVTQGDFLMAMGMQERIMKAIEEDKTTEEQAEDLYQAMVRLASPDEMGERYKVLCIIQGRHDVDAPPGF